MAAISQGEVAVYDRQLRLWGVQAQQRLLKSKVLVWGLEGCNVEVCKNLVLAGVALTVRDHRCVDEAALSFNYFLRQEDASKNRAECAAKRIQEMNPLCTVSSSISAPETENGKLREGLTGFDVVIVGLNVLNHNAKLASDIDSICREANIGFLLTVGAGEIAFFFSDLQEHIVQEYSGAQGGAGSTASEATEREPETLSYPSLSEWMKASPVELAKGKVDASVLMIVLFLQFLDTGKTLDDAGKFEEFCRSADCVPSVDGVASLQKAFATLFVEPLIHVASIVGGLMAQEVIKAITHRDVPLLNTVCFNARTAAALVERIPAQKANPAPKRKAEEAFDLDD
eukprot:TRINITY_DN8535_c0_g2_i2.p1 TRINITY_DN8535_c0_g2~~TRINITY_DN8535_c0_g2_i2.p1  ORF type:complete len:375 (-),score=83.20 TRINITY_DN8535_c0_g2_i2:87-1112(-)